MSTRPVKIMQIETSKVSSLIQAVGQVMSQASQPQPGQIVHSGQINQPTPPVAYTRDQILDAFKDGDQDMLEMERVRLTFDQYDQVHAGNLGKISGLEQQLKDAEESASKQAAEATAGIIQIMTNEIEEMKKKLNSRVAWEDEVWRAALELAQRKRAFDEKARHQAVPLPGPNMSTLLAKLVETIERRPKEDG